MPNPIPLSARPGRKTLASVVGVIAAAALFASIPKEESGRTVAVQIAPDGAATVRHISGRQYLQAYLDIAGVATACDGITRGVRMDQRYTEAQCTAMLEDELVRHAEGVLACTPSLRQPGRDWQRAATVSLAYNIGVGAWCGSTARRRFEVGDIPGGCAAFLPWDKARVSGIKRAIQGLTDRRRRELAMCLRVI